MTKMTDLGTVSLCAVWLSSFWAAAFCPAAEPLAAMNTRHESGADESALRRVDFELNASVALPERRKEVEADLIRLLAADTSFEAKRFACTRLAVCGTEASVPPLAALLATDETVGIACLALCTIKSARAGDALRAAVPASKGAARLQLVNALGRRAEAESVTVLSGLARDADVAVARAAIRALGVIDAAPARDVVAALRREAAPAVAEAVADASLAVAERHSAAGARKDAAAVCEELLARPLPTHLRRGAFGLLLRCQRDGGAERIAELLGRAPVDPVLAAVAIARVPELRGWRVSKTFGRLLAGLPVEQQVLLIEALSWRGDSSARAAVRAQAGAADARVRLAAVAALGRTEDEDAVPALVLALARAASPDETKSAELALAGLKGGEKADQALCAAVREAKEAASKATLLSVLARRGGPKAAAALLHSACGEDREAARAAAQALTRLADGADAAALPELQRALAGKDASRSDAALRALAAWRSADAWDALLGVYRKPANDAQRTLALRGLARIAGEGNAKADAALIGRYRQVLEGARDDGERKLVLNTLAGASHPDALALAVSLLSASGVRAEAAGAVERIAAALQKSHPDLAREALQRAKDGP